MNVAKLTSVDLPLFNGIVSDLFPGIETPAIDYSKFKTAIENQFKAAGLQPIPWAVTKVIQVIIIYRSRRALSQSSKFRQIGSVIEFYTYNMTMNKV